jgi:hypothetical protein
MTKRVQIDCFENNSWEVLLETAIVNGWEADLINFDLEKQGSACARIANRRNVELVVRPKTMTATVRHHA